MVHIATPKLEDLGDDVRIVVDIAGTKPAGKLRFRLPKTHEPSVQAVSDSLFPIGLLLAMSSGTPLVMETAVSPKLMQNSETIQDIYLSWYPETFKRAALYVEPRSAVHSPEVASGTVSTFTAGVDSLYTLHTNYDEIDTLLFVHGFDVSVNNKTFRSLMSSHLSAASVTAQKALVEGVTTVRRFLNPYLSWGKHSHAAAVASMAILLSKRCGRLRLPASYSYADLFPWGSHPLTDPLWSTEYFSVIHDGAGTSRTEKTRAIAHDTIAQKHMRVCYQRTGDYNCGRCKKCTRTMIALELEGVIDQFETFPNGLDISRIHTFKVKSKGDYAFSMENLELAKSVGRRDIVDELEKTFEGYTH
ncbi:hypothetical protein [Brevibacterium oceani]|uniref:hypothetical protein n=1 Tax=Brevibacterium oceani TaxID=358099 RepID=UPI001B33B3E9|nr:hypothetical protein [Brevibacterium oceani]